MASTIRCMTAISMTATGRVKSSVRAAAAQDLAGVAQVGVE